MKWGSNCCVMTSMHYAVVVTIHWPWPWPGLGDMLVALALNVLALALYSVALLTSLAFHCLY